MLLAEGLFSSTVAQILFPILTLILGLIIGYLAQRSGFCSIGGTRDLILFKHTRLFFGYIALIGSAFISYFLFNLIFNEAFPGFFWALQQDNPFQPIPGAPPGLTISAWIILAILGGFGLGFLGVLLGGCPLRQIIMGFEGNLKSIFFVIGTLVGAVIFHLWIIPAVQSLFALLGI